MKILDRYLLKEFTRNFLLSCIGLSFVFFISEYLRGIWNEEVPATLLLKYTSMHIPLIFCQMVPPSSMLSTMITLSSLNKRSELTAMHASGISLFYISSLFLFVILIFCIFTLVIYDRIVPLLEKQRTLYYYQVIKGRKDFSLDIKASKIWYKSKNYIYNIQTFDKSKNLISGFGVYLFDESFHLEQHIEAKSASYNENGFWTLKNGALTIFPVDKDFPISVFFEKKDFYLPESPNDFLIIEKQAENLRLRELFNFIQKNKKAGIDTTIYEVDFHSRLALSFIPLIMGLLAVPFSVKSQRQGGLGKNITTAFAFIFSYWLLFSISITMGKSGTIAPFISVWGPCFLFLILAIIMIYKNKNS